MSGSANEMSKEELRLFVAVDLPPAVREALGEVQRQLRQAEADAAWPRAEGLHLTLKFIGKTPAEHVPQLAADLDRAAGDCVAHEAEVAEELGAFPNLQRIRVVWAGLREPSGELQALQKRVEANVSWWSPPEGRPFAAHLTLGRVRSGRNVAALSRLIGEARLPAGLIVPVREVVLYSSQLTPQGAIHTPLHRAKLSVL